jgi:uncharacterized protein (DUF58 family)
MVNSLVDSLVNPRANKVPQPADPPIRVRRRYHLGIAGGVYVFVTFLIALGAFNSQNNLLFWAFGFALSLLTISGVISGAMLMGVALVREPVNPLVEDETGAVHYRVRNHNRLVPAFALTITEVTLPARTNRSRRRSSRRAGSPEPDALSGARTFVPHIPPGRSVAVTARLHASRRGAASLRAMLVSTSFPFGIIKKSLLFEQTTEVVVRPRLAPLPHGLVNSALRTGDRGQAPARRSGAGDEFFSLREYQPGDSLRDVAWRASARRGAGVDSDDLLVRQTAAPAPMRMHILLSFAGSPSAEADEQAIRLAAAAADAAITRNLAVGLRVLGAHTDAAPDLRARDGRLQRELIMDVLARLSPGETRVHAASHALDRDAETRLLRSPGVLLFIHAGTPETSFAPPWAIHLSASDARDIPAHVAERNPAPAPA